MTPWPPKRAGALVTVGVSHGFINYLIYNKKTLFCFLMSQKRDDFVTRAFATKNYIFLWQNLAIATKNRYILWQGDGLVLCPKAS